MRDLAREYAGCPADHLLARLRGQLARVPRCPITRYVLGCYCFDHHAPATAVRHFMIAHHAEPRLESAALLVFTGLNWAHQRQRPLLPILLETWEEFRRPAFDRHRREQLLLDAFQEASPVIPPANTLAAAPVMASNPSTPPPPDPATHGAAGTPGALPASAILALFWRLPIQTLRLQIRTAVSTPRAEAHSVLTPVGGNPTLPAD